MYPYISSSVTPQVGTKFTATYVGMVVLNNVAMVWSVQYCVHGTSCFVYFVSQLVHSMTHPYRFLFRNLFMETYVYRINLARFNMLADAVLCSPV